MQIVRRSMPCLIAAGLMLGSAPAWAADVAWRNTTPGPSPTAPDGSYSFEGTSNFAGEEVKITGKGVRTIIPSGRTSAGETVYRFADGSGFTLRFVAARIGGTVHQAGVFLNGTGRYAGIIGSAIGVPESRADANSPGSPNWRGSYELLKE